MRYLLLTILSMLLFPVFSLPAESRNPDLLTPKQVFNIEGLDKSQNWLVSRHILSNAIIHAFVDNKTVLPGYIQRLEAINPESAEVSYVRALLEYKNNNLVQSILLLEDSVEKEPTLDPAWNMLGYVLASANRHREALAAFDIASRLNPYHAIYRYNHALSLRALDRNKAALEQINMAVRIKENFSEAHYLKALILVDLNSYEEASKSFLSAKQFGISGDQFQLQYMTLAEKIGEEETLLELVKANAGSNNPDIRRISARLYLRNGDFRRAAYLFGLLAKSKDAILDDKKQYIRSLYYLNANPRPFIDQQTDEEKSELTEFFNDIQDEQKPSPGPRDPIVNPGK